MRNSSHMELLVADELRRIGKAEERETDKQDAIIIDRRDLSIDNTFRLKDEDAEGNVIDMPIQGEGVLDSFVIKSPNTNFSVSVEIDSFDALDKETFDSISNISTALSHIGAFSKSGTHTVSVSSYPFNERLNLIVHPHEEITFTIVRAEVIMGGKSGSIEGVDPEMANLLQ